MTRVGHSTVRDQYAYLNFEVAAIPVVIKMGGKNYTQQAADNLKAEVERCPTPHAVITGAAYIEDTKKGWQVSLYDTDFFLTPYQVPFSSYAEIRGKVLSVAPDQAGAVWADISASYYSKKPGAQSGEYKQRTIRVQLDKAWEQNIINHQMIVTGTLCAAVNGQPRLHVVASESVVTG